MNNRFKVTAIVIALIVATVVYIQSPTYKQYSPEGDLLMSNRV